MSTYQVYVHFDMSPTDQKVVALLYAPLLGHQAFTLYQTLYHLKTPLDTLYEGDFLYGILNMKPQDFQKARETLESFELLSTLVNQDMYVLQLKRPLTAKGFLTDVLFGTYLEHEIGKMYVSRVTELFSVHMQDVTTFKNISKTFSDMYTFTSNTLLTIDTPLIDNGGVKSKRMLPKVDVLGLIEKLPARFQKPNLLKEQVKDLIEQVSFIYQFSESDMIEVILRLDPNQIDNKPQLLLQAQLYYQSLQKTIDITKTNQTDSDKINGISPYYIIQKYSKETSYASALSTTVELISRNHVEVGIINTLLVFVLKRKEGVLPHLNYLEKILHSWLSKGIKTALDAQNFIQSIESNALSSQKKTRTKSKSVEPDWFDDYLKELEVEEAKL